MLIKSKIIELNKWMFLEEIQDQYLPYQSFDRNQLELNSGPIKITNNQIKGNGLFIWYGRMSFESAVHFHTETIGEAISIQLFSSSNENMLFSYDSYKENQCNRRSFSSLQHLDKNDECDFLIVVLSRHYFKNLLERNEKLRINFLQSQSFEKDGLGANSNYLANSEFQHIIKVLIDFVSRDVIDRNLLDEILINLFQENYKNLGIVYNNIPDSASQIDISKLEKAKQILEENISNPPTQKELAEEVFMSESKLRKDFKQHYGITIHDFLTQIRMQKARIYLLIDQLTVYEVASLTGYGHQNNFSYAFKKFFGYSPSDLKA